MDIGVTLLELANLKFKQPKDGIPLLKTDGKLTAIPDREQLIVGDLNRVRSLQLISFPFSYILNYDFFYKYWYFSGKILVLPGFIDKRCTAGPCFIHGISKDIFLGIILMVLFSQVKRLCR